MITNMMFTIANQINTKKKLCTIQELTCNSYQGFQHQATSNKGTWVSFLIKKRDFKGPNFNQNRDQFPKKGTTSLNFISY